MFAHFIKPSQRQELLQGRTMPLRIEYQRRPNARRYILRVNERGNGGCVTVPRRGSFAEARQFALRHAGWLEKRLRQHQENSLRIADRIFFRGELLPFAEVLQRIRGLEFFDLPMNDAAQNSANLRDTVHMELRRCAEKELPARVSEFAAIHGLSVRRVVVRDQRSRWGSCSVKAVISLNWRLVQTPEFVRDYIIIHELMHLREMNHSARFWKLVYGAFPQTDEAERWLKRHGNILRS